MKLPDRRQGVDALLEALKRPYDAILRPAHLVTLLVLTTVIVLLCSQFRPAVLSAWSPDEAMALGLIWQVHAAFVSIGFTGLSILFQLFSDPPLAVGTARRAITKYLRYRPLLALGLGADAIIAGAAIWFRSDANVLAVFLLVFLPSVGCIALAYAYSVFLYGHPLYVERLTIDDLAHLVRAACKEWVVDSNRDDEFVNALSALTPIPRERISQPTPERVAILYNGRAGTIAAIDIARLSNVFRQLKGLASNLDTPNRNVALKLNVRIGMELDRGALIAEIRSDTALDLSKIEALQGMVSSAIQMKSEFPPSPSAMLEEELSDLQDRLVAAITERRTARIKRGYRYCTVVERTIRTEMANHPARSPRGFLPLPDQQVVDNLYFEANYIAGRSGEGPASIAVDATFDRCSKALEDANLSAIKGALDSYIQIWGAMVVSDTDSASTYALLSVHNFAQYIVPSRPVRTILHSQAAQECVWTLVQMVKIAIDLENQAAAENATRYLTSLYANSGDPSGALRKEVLLGCLVLIGWILYRRDVRHLRSEEDLNTLLQHTPQGDIFDVSSRINTRDEARWRMWELERDGPVSAGIMVLSHYISQAAILVMARNGLRPPSQVDENCHAVANSLLSEIPAVRQKWLPALVTEGALEALETRLTRMVEEWERRQQAWLRSQPLDDQRIKLFVDTLSSELTSGDDDSVFIHRFARDGEQVRPASAQDGSAFGVNILVPKEYFVETDVYADPSDLAKNVARSIRAGEVQQVVEACERVGRSYSCEIGKLASSVLALVEEMARPIIVVFGYHEVMSALGSRDWTPLRSFGPKDVPVHMVYGEDASEHLMVVDLANAPSLSCSPVQQERLNIVGRTTFSAGVFTFDTDDTHYPQAHVRVLERMSWDLPESASVTFIYVPDAAW